MSKSKRFSKLPDGVHRTPDGFRVALSVSTPRHPTRAEYVRAGAQVTLVLLSLGALLLGISVGFPDLHPAYLGAYYTVLFAMLVAGAVSTFLLVRLLLELAGGIRQDTLDVHSDGFVYTRRGETPLNVAWCAVHTATLRQHPRPYLEVVAGWPDPSGELMLHELALPTNCAPEAARWALDSIKQWRLNTATALPAVSTIPSWVGRSEAAPTGLHIEHSGEQLQVRLGTTLRPPQDPFMRAALASVFALPLAVPAMGLPIWLALPVTDKHHLVPTLGIALAVTGVLLLAACIVVAYIALRSVGESISMDDEHLTLPATAEHKAVRVPWSSVLGSDVGVEGEQSKAKGVLQLRVDPVTAPIIPRRDASGRGLVVVGHGMPVEQLAWVADEVERRRQRATQTPAPPRPRIDWRMPSEPVTVGSSSSGTPRPPVHAWDEDTL